MTAEEYIVQMHKDLMEETRQLNNVLYDLENKYDELLSKYTFLMSLFEKKAGEGAGDEPYYRVNYIYRDLHKDTYMKLEEIFGGKK